MKKLLSILAVLILVMAGTAFAKGGHSGQDNGQQQSQQQSQGEQGAGHTGADSGDGVPNDWGGCN